MSYTLVTRLLHSGVEYGIVDTLSKFIDMRKQSQKYQFRILIPSLIVVTGIFALFSHNRANAFTEPSLAYPQYTTYFYNETSAVAYTGQIPEFLNTSAAHQRKFGSLVIGQQTATCNFATHPVGDPNRDTSGCALLCLNPVKQGPNGEIVSSDASITTDAANCKYSWSQIAVSASNLLTLFSTTVGTDRGYISVQAKPTSAYAQSGQLISLIAEAPEGTAGATPPTGLMADGGTTTNYSAKFAGTLAVVGTGGGQPQLCLNTKNGAEDCITSWTQTIQDPNIVTLQTMTASTVRTPDAGGVATGGVFVGGSLVTGLPVSSNQLPYSCGDGICSAPYESSTPGLLNYCPNDCL